MRYTLNCARGICARLMCMHRIRRVGACVAHTQQCSCRDVHGDAREALKDAQLGGSECQICHAVVSYVRAALSNDETKKEIELVRASPSITLHLKPLVFNATPICQG